MGEYARYEIMRRHGIDIGDDDNKKTKVNYEGKKKCPICGKWKVNVEHHMKDVHKKEPKP